MNTQRKRRHILSNSEFERLGTLGFDWGDNSKHWEEGFRHLKSYKDRAGDCAVPFYHVEVNFRLGRWVVEQRNRKGRLSSEQKERLDIIGFEWDAYSKGWEKAFACLETYKKRIGDCRVPSRYIENGFKLGKWVEKQRRSKHKLSEEQRNRLDQVGFEWDPRSSIRK